MDSNTINFSMLPNTINTPHNHTQMIDQLISTKTKSPSNDSTNFLEYQRFQNQHSSSNKKDTDSNNTSDIKSSFPSLKTKPIQKPNKLLKEQQKHHQNPSHNQFHTFTSRTTSNQNSQIKNVTIKSKKDVTKKPLTIRSHSFVSIFDWMMEIAAIMKLSRSTFYRACNIFYQTSKKDPKIMQNTNVQKYACASLLISAKLQKSNTDYLDELYFINKSRMSKQLITTIQLSIYQTLQWRLPLYNLVSQQIIDIITKWNNYLQKCEKLELIKIQKRDRLTVSLEYSQTQLMKNKTYGQILYLFDMIVLNQCKKYMNSMNQSMTINQCDIKDYKQRLFTTPIVIALYSVLTIQQGDTQNKQKSLMLLFKKFYKQELQMPATQIDRLSTQIQVSFMLFNFASHLRKIQLTKDWRQVIQNDVICYLTVKAIKKHQIN